MWLQQLKRNGVSLLFGNSLLRSDLGRRSLDMKGDLTILISSILEIARSKYLPAGDVIFAALVDEESGGKFGSEYLEEKY